MHHTSVYITRHSKVRRYVRITFTKLKLVPNCEAFYFQYLQLRFNRSVRVVASVLGTTGMLLCIPVIMYVPALALSQGMF
jgi:hypothetical protein